MASDDSKEYTKVVDNYSDLPPITSGAYNDSDRYWVTINLPLDYVKASVAAFGQVQAIQQQEAATQDATTNDAPTGNVE